MRRALTHVGIPVRRGRLHLGRLRLTLPASGPIAVAVGVASAAWLGPMTAASPNLGRLADRSVSHIDKRGRVVLDRRVPMWLGVADAAAFEVVVVHADPVGVIIVPVEDFDGRWLVLSPWPAAASNLWHAVSDGAERRGSRSKLPSSPFPQEPGLGAVGAVSRSRRLCRVAVCVVVRKCCPHMSCRCRHPPFAALEPLHG